MLELYKLLSGIIDPICPSFADHYPEDVEEADKDYPYVELKFPSALPNNSFSDNNLLEVDIWDDKGTDIREIEGIADVIHAALNRLHYGDEAMYVSINRNTPHRLSLPDLIIHIQRRQLRYVLTVYKK